MKIEKWNYLRQELMDAINEINTFDDADLEVGKVFIQLTTMKFFETEEIANDNCRTLDLYGNQKVKKK